MKHLFILNPVAGKGKTLGLVPEIKKYCEEKHLEYDIAITKYPRHATEIAKAQSSQQNIRFYSVGGDGTLNEVLNGMAGSGSSLACIPSGSGNDFIKSIAGTVNHDSIVKAAVEGTEHMIDYARVNDKFFLNITSVGFDAKVAYQMRHFRRIPLISGKMAYILGVLTSIIMCDNQRMRISVDDKIIDEKTCLVAVGNGKYYGGGMKSLPGAITDDGMFDVCHVGDFKRLKILRLFPRYMKGRHTDIKGVSMYRGKKVDIALDKPLPMNLDGEIVLVEKASFEMIHKGLPFVFPKL